jgi:hypothetical protein
VKVFDSQEMVRGGEGAAHAKMAMDGVSGSHHLP